MEHRTATKPVSSRSSAAAVEGIDVAAFPGSLGQLPIASADGIAVLLDEVDAAVLDGGDERRNRIFPRRRRCPGCRRLGVSDPRGRVIHLFL